MKAGENHRIFLIKGNEELIALAKDAKAKFDEYQKAALAAMENPEGNIVGRKDEKRIYATGCSAPGKDKDAFKQDKNGFYIPNKKTKSGKRINQALRVLGPYDRLSYTWMCEKGVFIDDLISVDGHFYWFHSVLSTKEDCTEFLLFIPKVDESPALTLALEAAAGLGEEITYGQFYDNYREIHTFGVR